MRAASKITDNVTLEVMNKQVRSDHRNSIHREIRSFVTGKFPNRSSDPKNDIFLEMIVELIRQYTGE